jgi:Flp pilus assembly protein TadG
MTAMTKSRGMCRPQAGQAMVEFMLVAIFIVILFASIVQMIMYMYAYTTYADAAKEGVRYAIVHGTGRNAANCSGPGNPSVTPVLTCIDSAGNNVKDAVVNFGVLSFQNFSRADVTVNYNPNSANGAGTGCSAAGCLVRVTVAHTYTPLFFKWASFTLRAAADGRVMN